MKISTKGRYSLRMLLDLAEHKNEGFVSLKEISDRQGISKKYLEQLVLLLNRPEILKTNRGNKGGYMLARDPSQYTVGQILRITEGGLSPVTCLDQEPPLCPRMQICKTLPVWQGLERTINDYLDGITLQDLIDSYGARESGMYHI
ncbi:MAG: Rrf2 family transcriptional regulator [Treponema sp.]|nr:Rrf2 family transcriptional regulator [Treponema sp.]